MQKAVRLVGFALVFGGYESFAAQYHFVAFSFKDNVTISQKNAITVAFLGLKDLCGAEGISIQSLSAGRQNSKEQLNQGYSDGFAVQFPDSQMRDKYVGCLDKPCQQGGTKPSIGYCAAHDDFKVSVGPLLETGRAPPNYNAGVLVFDYTGDSLGDLPGKVVHSVFFRYLPGTTSAEKREVESRFLDLKNLCDGVEQIVSGDRNSKEDVDQLYEQGYIVTFESEHFRDVYVGCLDKPCQLGGLQPEYGWCRGHDDFKMFVGDYLGGTAPPQLDAPANSYHYSPGVFVHDFISTEVNRMINV